MEVLLKIFISSNNLQVQHLILELVAKTPPNSLLYTKLSECSICELLFERCRANKACGAMYMHTLAALASHRTSSSIFLENL